MSCRFIKAILFWAVIFAAVDCAYASTPSNLDDSTLERVFGDAQKIDLRNSRVPSVVKLREKVKIPPPEQTVLLKYSDRGSLAPILKPLFSDPNIMGMTINKRFVVVMRTGFTREEEDILSHELVHAYISLSSPTELPFWFHEGSAVYFSTNRIAKFYGKESEREGVLEGRVSQIPDTYRQKLHNFQYLAETSGDEKFFKWYRGAVLTGNVDARPLLGLKPKGEEPAKPKPLAVSKPVLYTLIVAGILILGILGYAAARFEAAHRTNDE